MKKPNRRRDILLQRKRERQRVRKQSKPDREISRHEIISEERQGFDLFGMLSKLIPRERVDLDTRKRHTAHQEQGDR